MKHIADKLAHTEKLERLAAALAPEKAFRAGGLFASSSSALILALATGGQTPGASRQKVEQSKVEQVNVAHAGSSECSTAPLLSSQLSRALGRAPICLITPTIESADLFTRELEPWLAGRVVNFPAWESLAEEKATPDFDIYAGRLNAVARLGGGGSFVLVGSVQAFLQPVCEADALERGVLDVRAGERRDMKDIARWLVARIERTDMVDSPGQFSIRGGVMDIFPVSAGGEMTPVRLDFFGDTVESIRLFDPATQRSTENVESSRIIAVEQSAFFRPMPEAGAATLAQRLPQDALVIFHETPRIEEKVRELDTAAASSAHDAAFRALARDVEKHARLEIASLPYADEDAVNFDVRSVQRFEGKMEDVRARLAEMAASDEELIIFVNNDAEAQRLTELFGDILAPGVRRQGEVPPRDFGGGLTPGHGERFQIVTAPLEEGFDFRDISAVALPYHQLFNRRPQARLPRKYAHFAPVDDFIELEKNDYVVHLIHGIGRYLGVERVERDGLLSEYLVIEYQENARIYEPILNIELVQKYIGVKGFVPHLDRIGAKYWSSRTARVKEAVKSMAAELLRVQAMRAGEAGTAFPPDDVWQHEFERAFEYEETPDQLQATLEVKSDMQNPKPMDRLICGDVGYGKTEVAMRAAFKTVSAGKQVAVLVPTTILAQQHYKTFRQRVADFPVTVETLSRFRSGAEQRRTLEGLKAGTVDIVIGTHRLLSDDIQFADLGLLIIDEEQRFGVAHKEKLKRLRATVDIITMTATPIPRTLHMAMLGIKDISSLTTPPRDRLAIQTEVCPYDARTIREGILRELNRDGQVFFVHNRVMSIRKVANDLAKIVPEAAYAIIHGQMPEDEIERVMVDFVERKYDVLVATTIIESGLDIPNVNTIFIDDAHTYGLADLHQLRGRVGRYKHRAYAYLLLPGHAPLSEVAEKRLRAIEEFNELGSGFKIAMRDLEIRGAGNILGAEQHGHIAAVGYELYCRLLKNSVGELKNLKIDEPITAVIDVGLDASIPADYVPGREQRMRMYRRISAARSSEELEALADEMRDRFGEPPEPVRDLLDEAAVRVGAARRGISKVQIGDGALVLQVRNFENAERALKALKGRVRVIDDRTIHVVLRPSEMNGRAALQLLKKCLH